MRPDQCGTFGLPPDHPDYPVVAEFGHQLVAHANWAGHMLVVRDILSGRGRKQLTTGAELDDDILCVYCGVTLDLTPDLDDGPIWQDVIPRSEGGTGTWCPSPAARWHEHRSSLPSIPPCTCTYHPVFLDLSSYFTINPRCLHHGDGYRW